jgi:hypothetical protein
MNEYIFLAGLAATLIAGIYFLKTLVVSTLFVIKVLIGFFH